MPHPKNGTLKNYKIKFKFYMLTGSIPLAALFFVLLPTYNIKDRIIWN